MIFRFATDAGSFAAMPDGQPEAVGEVGDDLAQVQRDGPALDLHARAAALDDRDECFVGAPVGLLPDRLRLRCRERALGALFGDAVQRARERAGERREFLGQAGFELARRR